MQFKVCFVLFFPCLMDLLQGSRKKPFPCLVLALSIAHCHNFLLHFLAPGIDTSSYYSNDITNFFYRNKSVIWLETFGPFTKVDIPK